MFKFRISLLISLLTLFASIMTLAQDNDPELELFDNITDSEALIRQVNYDRAIFSDFESKASIRQYGIGNEATVTQTGSSTAAAIIQTQAFGRTGNLTAINQNGNDIYSGVIQTGSGNEVDLNLVGDRIATGVKQYGLDNTVDLDLLGDNMLYGIIQVGRGHTIQHESDGNSLGFGINRTLLVRQRGFGASLIINGNK